MQNINAMTWGDAGRLTVIMCLLLWHPIYKLGQTLLFRWRLRRILNACIKDNSEWARCHRDWEKRSGPVVTPQRVDISPDMAEKQKLYREAEALGFTDQGQEPRRSA